jgi:hypothetical protein
MNQDMGAVVGARAPIKTFEELASLVDGNAGVFTVTMGELRDAYGVRKLGVHIRNGISEKLRTLGLRHLPDVLPIYQEEYARIYRDGSPVGKLIAAAVHGNGEGADQVLRDAAGGEDTVIVKQIRELVCS